MNIAPRNTDLEYNMEDLLSYEELLIAQNTRVEEVSYVLLEKIQEGLAALLMYSIPQGSQMRLPKLSND
jgi:hypothetical protein